MSKIVEYSETNKLYIMGIESLEEKKIEQCAWLETLINKYANDKSIARVIKVDIKSGSAVGDNYTSQIKRAILTVILNNGQKSKTSVIIKSAHVDKEKLKILQNMPVFKSETMVYCDILKKCEVLMDEYQDSNEKLWCDLISYRPYNLIIFEDLKRQNYLLADRTKMLDLNHSLLVLHNLGRLHGLCYVLIQKGLLKKTDVGQFYIERDSTVVEKLYRGGLKMLSQVMEKYWPPEWKEIAERLYKEEAFIIGKLKKLFQPQENTFETLCHGDCWTCNMMFKYCPYNDDFPIAMKFIDFQTVHINSYVYDIMHFLYVTVQAEVRRTNFNRLLKVYQKSLQSTLAIYGMEEKAPSLQHVQEEVERTEYFGFAAHLIILPITAANVHDAFKLEFLNENSEGMEAFNPIIFQSELYKCTVQPELKGWFKKGLF